MNRSLLTRVATGASVAALATAGAAYAATGHSHGGPQGGPGGGPGLADAATYLGLSQSTLQADLRKGETLAQVASSTPGKSTSGLIDALVAAAKAHGVTDPNLTTHITSFVDGTRPGRGPGPRPELAAAATYLGISGDALRTDLQGGKTLAQVADATSGKSASGLIATLVAADRTRITALVNGRLPAHP